MIESAPTKSGKARRLASSLPRTREIRLLSRSNTKIPERLPGCHVFSHVIAPEFWHHPTREWVLGSPPRPFPKLFDPTARRMQVVSSDISANRKQVTTCMIRPAQLHQVSCAGKFRIQLARQGFVVHHSPGFRISKALAHCFHKPLTFVSFTRRHGKEASG